MKSKIFSVLIVLAVPDATLPLAQLSPEFAMVRVRAGSFTMGSDNGEPDEQPRHRVTLTNGFEIGKYEVTQSEWQAVMGQNPSEFRNCPRCPVERVSWNAAQQFLMRLNASQTDYTYRLPTEAE